MKKLAVLAALFLAWPAYADDDDRNRVRARLTGFQEVPSVSTVAQGRLRAEVNRGGQSIDYTVSYSGLQGTVTQAHVHIGQRGVNGGIVLWICGTNITVPPTPGPAGTPTCTSPDGHFAGTWRAADVQAIGGANAGQQISAGEIDEVVRAIRAGVAYANVHTVLSPGGEIRGQIRGDDDRHKH